MSRPILMSIRPEYADKILDGSKTVEFRKQAVLAGSTVIIYRSGPAHQRGVVGWFTSGAPIEGCAVQLHVLFDRPGIDVKTLAAYAGGPYGLLAGIPVRDVHSLHEPLPIAALGFRGPPQSWRYAPEDWAQRLGVEVPA